MEQLEDKKVKLGSLIKVKNTNKRKLENDVYVALQVEDLNGDNERCLLFTEIEIADMEKVQCDWIEKDLVAGRIYPITIGNRQTNLIKVFNQNDSTKLFRVSNTQLKRAEKRAAKNPEDLTKKSWFTNLID